MLLRRESFSTRFIRVAYRLNHSLGLRKFIRSRDPAAYLTFLFLKFIAHELDSPICGTSRIQHFIGVESQAGASHVMLASMRGRCMMQATGVHESREYIG